MVQNPENRVAVIVGASSGFGAGIAQEMAVEGWHTIGIARREDRLIDLAAETGGEYEACDVTDARQVGSVATSLLERHPDIGALIYSAGMPLRELAVDTDPDEYMRAVDTNSAGFLRFVQALRPGLEAGDGADVIDIVSAAATITNPNSGSYSSSKGAQRSIDQSLREDLRPFGINIHTILPGKADTEGHPQKPSNSLFSRLTRTDVGEVTDSVLKRIGKDPKEIYVPRILKVAGVAGSIAPIQVTRVVAKMLS